MEALTTYPCDRCRKEVCLSGHSALFYVTQDHRTLAVCADCQEMLDDAHEQIDEQDDENEPEKVECFECDRTFIAYRDESHCPECIEIISINRAHA